MRFVIIVSGGVVDEVFCSEDSEYLVIDTDVMDGEQVMELTDTDGRKFDAEVGRCLATVNRGAVDHYFSQVR